MLLSKTHLPFLSIGLVAVAVSCSKSHPNAPEAIALQEAQPFTLTVREDRDGHILDWTHSGEGIRNAAGETGPLHLTRYNTATLRAEGTGEGDFKGVNVSVTNPSAVKITRKGPSVFTLKYVADGEALITVTSGSGSESECKYFPLVCKGTIPLEGFLVRITDHEGKKPEERLLKVVPFEDVKALQSYENVFYELPFVPDGKVEYRLDMTMADMCSGYTPEELFMHKVEFLHAVPENTTWRHVYSGEVIHDVNDVARLFGLEYDWFDREVRPGQSFYDLPSGADVSLLYGKSAWMYSSPRREKSSREGTYHSFFYLPLSLSQKRAGEGSLPGSEVRTLCDTYWYGKR